LMDGSDTLERCSVVTEQALHAVFSQMVSQGVSLEYLIVKPNMVAPGLECSDQMPVDVIADASVRTLMRAVPAAVPGVAFLSGGQTSELASARLNAMNLRFKDRLPWRLTFSFSRALQNPALEIWAGKDDNKVAAQQALYHRAKCNSDASMGTYQVAMEAGGWR
jgi:fructose-bisphosphate aldolase class I